MSNLIFYLNIMIERNHNDRYIEFIESDAHGKDQYTCAYIIIRNISRYCNIDMNEGEIYYLTNKLGSYFFYSSTAKGTKQAIAIELLTKQLIHNVSKELNINLENDYQFYEKLSDHMISIYQKQIKLDKNNPLLQDIKENQTRLINIIKHSIGDIENYYRHTLNETELLYIVIHFSAAIDRSKSLRKDFNVIIVCNEGIATSQFLKAKLQSIFNIKIIAAIPKYELDTVKNTSADLIISTVPLYNTPIAAVQVSANLTADDYAAIGSELNKLQNQKIKIDHQSENQTFTLAKIMNIINPLLYTEIPSKADQISSKISKELLSKFKRQKKEADELYLYELLSAPFIRLNVDCRDWKEAIIESGKALIRKGYINDHYIQNIISTTEKLGPYYIIGSGVAIPHAGIEDGSFNTGMSMIRLTNPVLFDGGDDPSRRQPIRYVIMMCLKDEHSHLKAFFHLLTLLHDTNIISEMDTISSPEIMHDLIQIREMEIKEY